MVRFGRANHVVTRATSAILLLVGAGLLIAWLASPATSAPSARPLAPTSPLDTAAPLLDEITAQARLLHRRLADRSPAQPPSRDPFRFSDRHTSSAATSAPMAPAAALPAEPPRLVAILTDEHGGHRAVFEAADEDVRFVGVGETVDGFVVREIKDDAVSLDNADGRPAARLALR